MSAEDIAFFSTAAGVASAVLIAMILAVSAADQGTRRRRLFIVGSVLFTILPVFLALLALCNVIEPPFLVLFKVLLMAAIPTSVLYVFAYSVGMDVAKPVRPKGGSAS